MTAVKKWEDPIDQILLDIAGELSPKVELRPFSDVTKSAEYANAIAISEEAPPPEVLQKFIESNLQHLVHVGALSFDQEVLLANLMITNPDKFFENPTNAILDPKGVLSGQSEVKDLYHCKFTDLKEKYQILDDVEKVLNVHCRSSSFIYDVQSVVDEMVTNAIFHATENIDERKNHFNQGHHGELHLAMNDRRLVVSCSDPHGSLDPMKLFERIHTCYTSEVADKINMGRGGAGIGSFLVHNMSSSYIVAVNENVETVISSIIPMNMSNKKRINLPKNLHYLQLKENENE